jgi:uncharacterized membrane protein
VSELVVFLVIVALGVALRRAFVRIDELHRDAESLRDRLAAMEIALVARTREGQRTEFTSVDLPPKGGSHETQEPAAPLFESRGFRPQAEGPAEAGSHETAHATIHEEPESLESQIGTQWLLYIGVIAIVIGVAYFEKLAIDNQWIGETARVIQGGALGLLLVYVGTRFVRSGYALYGQMISGGGAAILYVSTYAAFNFYHLIDRPVAFALMIAITAMVAWLADWQRSQGLALFAVGGGFGTPFLLPGTTDAQLALFGYDAILIGGTMFLSHRRNWPVLNIVSYLFTIFTVAGWADRFYTSAKYLRTELFLTLFCAMFLYILRQCRAFAGTAAQVATAMLWTAPAAYYLASWIILQDHSTAMLVWLVAVMLVGGIVSDRMGTAAGFVMWIAVTLPLLMWTTDHAGRAWQAAGLATIGGIYVIALAAQLLHAFDDEPADPGVADIAWLHLNGLLMFAGAYFLISAVNEAITGTVAAVFALWQGVLAAWLVNRRRDLALHFAALGFTLLSIAIALQFDGPAVTIGWAAEGAVIIALGLRERRGWLRAAGVVLFAIAIGRAMSLLTTDREVGEAVLLNARAASAALIAVLCYVIAWLHYRDADAPDRDVAIGAALVTAQVVTLALLTSEITAYWTLHGGRFARELMVSVTWGAYATALIVIGLQRSYAPIRYFAIVVFAVTIFKVFALDMAQLDRIYRVSSVIGLGILLLLTSYLYNRSRRA